MIDFCRKWWPASIVFGVIFTVIFSGCTNSDTEIEIENDSCTVFRKDKEDDLDLICMKLDTKVWKTKAYNERSLSDYEKDIIIEGNDMMHFSSVDYALDEGAQFGPHTHLCYMVDMSLKYGKERIKNDATARKRMIALLNHYLWNDYYSQSNWWWNVIGIPSQMSILGIMYKDYLDDNQLSALSGVIERGLIQYNSEGELLYTGANLVDEVNNCISYSVLTGRKDEIIKARDVLANELTIKSAREEGILTDMAYIQAPGVICMAGSYGLVFDKGIGHIISILWGTDYELPDDCVKLLVDHILDGDSFFTRGYQSNYFTLERRSTYSSGAEELAYIVEELASLEDIYRKEELKKYYRSFTDYEYTDSSMKYFDCAYILSRKNSSCNISVKGSHAGIYPTMIQNDQGFLNYNLSCGSNTCYMSSGNEYKSIGAVFDYSQYPGITTFQETDEELIAHMSNYGKTWGVKWNPDIPAFEETESVNYCSGYVDEINDVGVLYMDYKHESLTGILTYIIHGDALYALGCNLCGENSNDKGIITTINQCKEDSTITSQGKLQVGDCKIVPMGGVDQEWKF